MAEPITYVIDACALIAFLDKEKGWERVDDLLERAENGEIKLFMNAVNFWEVYYDRLKTSPTLGAPFLVQFHNMAIKVIGFYDDEVFYEAGSIKSAHHRMALADAIALGTAAYLNATFVTCDHGDLAEYEHSLDIPIFWIRPPQPKKTKIPGIRGFVEIPPDAEPCWNFHLPQTIAPGTYRAVLTLTPEADAAGS
jgi:predicted nucleic acid-binding protein